MDDYDPAGKRYVDDRTRAVVAANVQALTTVETPVLVMLIPAGKLAIGSTFDYQAFLHPAATTITTVRVRIGPTGTAADPAVVVMSATAATSAASRWVEGVVSVLTTGVAATFLGGGNEVVGAVAAAGAAAATSGTFDTTKDCYISVTVQNTTSTTTTIYSARGELSY